MRKTNGASFSPYIFGDGTQNRHASAHTANKLVGNRFIHRHQILFFVIVTGTQNLIDQIAVVSQKYQPL